ncbi:MAG: DUF5819 family protein [Leucobacter sp.]
MSAEDTSGSEGERARPKPWVRAAAFGAALLTAWHVFASFLWIGPVTPLREVVPGEALTSYMIPLFGQSWSVFAPEPINGDYHFNVRAVLDRDGEEVETGWVSATDVELSMIRYNLFPPRAGIQSSEVASQYKGSYDRLGSAQKAVVAETRRSDAWEEELRGALLADPSGDGGSAPLGDEAGEADVDRYIAAEHLSTAYATQVAGAIWGDEVVSVQFRVSRQNIVPFAERNSPEAQRPEPTVAEPGWRARVVEPGQNAENFAGVFRSQYERISR